MNKINKNKKNRGFTLVELMVSTSIFAMVMLASLGSLFTLLGASKDSRATNTAMDNVNFALESMTRSIRMGSKYVCTQAGSSIPEQITSGIDCLGGGTVISFLPQNENSNPTNYMRDNLSLGSDRWTLKRCIAGADCVQVVSDDVDIEELEFYVSGSAVSDKQPSVFIRLKGEVTVKDENIPFFIQTFINQRNY